MSAQEMTVINVKIGDDVELAILKENESGLYFGVDASFVEQEAGPIHSPYGNGLMALSDTAAMPYPSMQAKPVKNGADATATLADKVSALRETKKGQALVRLSEAKAAQMLFDLESGDLNADVAEDLSPNDIYTACQLTSSLCFDVNNKQYTLEPYHSGLSTSDTLDLLADIQSSLEFALLESHVMAIDE